MTTNNYIPESTPSNLPWYEIDGLITWLDKVKCDEFLEDFNKHFRKKKIVNFYIIYKSNRGEKIPEGDLKKYQTVQNNRVKQYPQKDKDKLLFAAFRTDRKDLHFEKEVANSYFKLLSKK